MTLLTIRPVEPADRDAVVRILRDRWGSERQVANGEVFFPADHPGFIAWQDGNALGLVTHRIHGAACEITLIDSGTRHTGIGTSLLKEVENVAQEAGCTRLWLVTTNDNLDALRFYQRRGFVLSALRRNELDRSRLLKPEISAVGEYGIPLRDEIELEKPLR